MTLHVQQSRLLGERLALGLRLSLGYENRETPQTVLFGIDHSPVLESDEGTENNFKTLWNWETKI